MTDHGTMQRKEMGCVALRSVRPPHLWESVRNVNCHAEVGQVQPRCWQQMARMPEQQLTMSEKGELLKIDSIQPVICLFLCC